MQIDTAGTYTLKYTAEDACGNVTEVTREVEAIQITYRTVLYTDGTFIINEKSTDQAANEALHGAVTNEYDPLDANHNYVFSSTSSRPWYSKNRSILSVEIGSPIKPQSTAYWFDDFRYCQSMDLSNIDTSETTDMQFMFSNCQTVASLDVSHFDTSNVTKMNHMFYCCLNVSAFDLSNFNTSNVTDMNYMFNGCPKLTALDLSSFDTAKVTDMQQMFENCTHLTSLDISNFDTSEVTNMNRMFLSCEAIQSLDLSSFDTTKLQTMNDMFDYCYAIKTIYATSLFTIQNVTSDGYVFQNCNQLVGGQGTTWSSAHRLKDYARIDNPPDAPGYFTLKSA